MKITVAFALLIAVLALTSAVPRGPRGGNGSGGGGRFRSRGRNGNSESNVRSSSARSEVGQMMCKDKKMKPCKFLLMPKEIVDSCVEQLANERDAMEGVRQRRSPRGPMKECMMEEIMEIVNDGNDNVNSTLLVNFINQNIQTNKDDLPEEIADEVTDSVVEKLRNAINEEVPDCISNAEDAEDAFKKLKRCMRDVCDDVFGEEEEEE